jgi:hypothetical protein
MERFAPKTNMYLACGDGPFLRQRVEVDPERETAGAGS